MIPRPLACAAAALVLSVAASAVHAQGVAPAGTGTSPNPRAALPGSAGSHVPIEDGQKRQPGGGGTDGLPDPLAGRAALQERGLQIAPNTPFVPPRDLTGAPLPNDAPAQGTASPRTAPGTGANTTPAPGR